MDTPDLDKLATLSPFELKDVLITLAGRDSDRMMLNAGRGNPNFLATVPRHAFLQLGRFAMTEAERSFAYMPEGVGGFPLREGLERRFEQFARECQDAPGVKFLRGAVSYVRDQMGLSGEDFLYEMCEGWLGCNYPVPDRMLTLSERIVAEYIRMEMIGHHPFTGGFDLFAVEGGTAAMTYLFNTMRENFLLAPGDTIAIGLPIFTPYIEIPELNDYRLTQLAIDADPEAGWQIPDAEIDKLLDPAVKAFFVVNPSNPPSVKLNDDTLERLADIVAQRPDLIILTDDVYGTFADDFVSLFASCPHNTILVYSFSKYFGATGWRLGVIATHAHNILDDAIAALPEERRKALDARYQSITTDPRALKFIDRLVADSRTVALNHTAGLSTPQQVQMVLFSLFSLMDEQDNYKEAMKHIVRRRKAALYRELGVEDDGDENSVDYYTILDLEILGTDVFGRPFVDWLLAQVKPNELLFRLASDAGVVLMPGKGFGTRHPSARVSLANLNEMDYVKIGRSIRTMMEDYHARFEKETSGARGADAGGGNHGGSGVVDRRKKR